MLLFIVFRSRIACFILVLLPMFYMLFFGVPKIVNKIFKNKDEDYYMKDTFQLIVYILLLMAVMGVYILLYETGFLENDF